LFLLTYAPPDELDIFSVDDLDCMLIIWVYLYMWFLSFRCAYVS